MATQDTAITGRRRFAQSLLAQGMQATPVQHWSQALARAVQGGMGGYLSYQADEEERAKDKEIAALLSGAPGLGSSNVSADLQPPLAARAPDGMDRSISAGPRSASMPPVTMEPPAAPSPYKVAGMAPPTNSQDTFRTPLDAMAPREQGLAALSTAMGGTPPMTGMNPAGATPVQTQAITPPRQLAQSMAPPPARAPVEVPPQMQAYIKGLMGRPETRAQGLALYQQYSKPQEPSFDKLNDDTLYNKKTGETKPVGPGYRPLTDPEERARFGIPAEDKRPYQLGPAGKLINPPAETRITVDQRGESKFREKAGGLIADRFNDYVKSGDDARGMVADLDSLREIGSRLTTGKTAEITAALGPWAEAVGVKIEGLSDLQAFKSITSKMAPRMRPPGSGATSDYEMRQYLESLPTLGKTPEGNEIIANTQQSILAHRQAVAEIASRAMAGEIEPREAEKQIRALPDPMAMWKKSRGASPAGGTPTTPKLETRTINGKTYFKQGDQWFEGRP